MQWIVRGDDRRSAPEGAQQQPEQQTAHDLVDASAETSARRHPVQRSVLFGFGRTKTRLQNHPEMRQREIQVRRTNRHHGTIWSREEYPDEHSCRLQVSVSM